MAQIYGEIDSLKKILALLDPHTETELNSVNDILSYKKVCDEKLMFAKVIATQEYETSLKQRKDKIFSLESVDGRSRAKKILKTLHLSFLKWRARGFERRKEEIIKKEIMVKAGFFYKAKNIIDSNYNLILGAQGEQLVLDELEKLPEEFTVINNFEFRSSKPIYNKRTGQRIYSAQADHVVVGPSGVFLIETKNWSKSTLENNESFGPFEQVKRTNFALFYHLNWRSKGIFSFLSSPKKVSVRSILLMTNTTTDKKDPFVKVLSITGLNGYISWFSPTLTEKEVRRIVERLR